MLGPGEPPTASTSASTKALAAVPGAEDRDAAIHDARKATKRARYATEAALPALGKKARRQARRAKEQQQLLGDHHDSVVARTALLDLAKKARAAGGKPSPTA
jgi:CHAD domain-containing protein